MFRSSFATLLSAAGLVCAPVSAQPVEWLNPVNGSWQDDANWVGGAAPSLATQQPVLGLAGVYSVSSSADTTHGALTISNPDARLLLVGASHSVLGDIQNNGAILSSGSITLSDADRRIEGAGALRLNAPSDPGESVLVADGVLVTHAAGHTIRGSGRLTNESDDPTATGAFRNRGLITANEPGGSGLELLSVVLEQTGGGRIGADAGTLILTSNSGPLVFETSITGGELFVINGGSLRLGNTRSVSLNDMTITGLIDIDEPDRELRLGGAIDLQGRISLNPSGSSVNTEIGNRDEATIGGNGEVVLRTSGTNASEFDSDALLTIGSGVTLRGSGTVFSSSAGIVNDGAIVADDPAEDLVLRGAYSGAGLFGANGGRLVLGPTVDLDGCTLDTLNGGVVEVSENFIDFIGGGNEGDLELAPGATLQIKGTYTNNGTISQPVTSFETEQVILRDDATIAGNGRFEFFDDFRSGIRESGTKTVTIGPGQTLFGAFMLGGDLLIEGTIEPEGKVEIDGDVVMAPTSVLRMELDASGLNDDRIDLRFNNATLTLGGTLELDLEDGVVPFDGQLWFIIDGEPDDELFGFFDSVVPPDGPPGFTYVTEVVFGGLRIMATATPCPADIAEPFGVLDLSDINAFINGFVTQDPIADLAEPSGVWDLSDVNAFVGSFVAGCP